MSIKGSGLLELLKEGSSHMSGLEAAVLRNVEACAKLSAVVRTSLGPSGKKKMVINHLGKLFVTADSSTIVKELEVVHPAARLVVLAGEMQSAECGDASSLTLVLAGELLACAEPLLRMGLHPAEIVSGYKRAGEKAVALLDSLVCATVANLRDADEVARYLRPVVASKQYGYETFLSALVAKACVGVLSADQTFNADNVRSVKILGGGVTDSSLIRGFVTARGAEGDVRVVKDAKVAVFAAGIDAAKTETKGVVRMTNAAELSGFSAGEEAFVEKLISEIAASGATVLVSGGAVGELAMHYIERAGIMVVKINSKFELRRLCTAVGATPLVRLGKPLPEELGRCSSVRTEEIGSTTVTLFEQSAADSDSKSQLATLVLRGSTVNILDDFERAVTGAVAAYKTMTKDGRYVAGAGAAEMELAKLLREMGEGTATLEQYAILKYAEALEVVPRVLLDNAGVDSTHAIASLVAAHQKGQRDAGVSVETGAIGDAAGELHVFDSVAAKKSAIQLATDAATTVLRIDQLIMSKAAGGPKPPQMGPMDAD